MIKAGMLNAVRRTIREIGARKKPEFAALIRLAEVYADEIDAREPLANLIKRIGGIVDELVKDPSQHGDAVALADALDRLKRGLAEGKVLTDTGPKLFTVLEALIASPASRARLAGRVPSEPDQTVKTPAEAAADQKQTTAKTTLRALRGGRQ